MRRLLPKAEGALEEPEISQETAQRFRDMSGDPLFGLKGDIHEGFPGR